MPSKKVMYISIHAPLTGSDPVQPGLRSGISISIHAPLTGSDYCHIFLVDLIAYFNPRSPHRERLNAIMTRLATDTFQSTLPSQGATDNLKLGYGGTKISIHAPLTGSDARVATEMVFSTISIHAPLTGSDYCHIFLVDLIAYFNPRSPHRERLINNHNAQVEEKFQSTLPSQGATATTDISRYLH